MDLSQDAPLTSHGDASVSATTTQVSAASDPVPPSKRSKPISKHKSVPYNVKATAVRDILAGRKSQADVARELGLYKAVGFCFGSRMAPKFKIMLPANIWFQCQSQRRMRDLQRLLGGGHP